MFKGVLFGVCVDVGGSYLVGTVMFIVYASTLSTADMSSDDLRAVGITYTSLITSFDNVWSWTGLLFGLSCSVLGGYVCAAHAREKRVTALSIVAVLMAVVSFQSVDGLEVGVNLVLCLLTAAAVIQGGRLWAARHARESTGETGDQK